MATDKKQTLVSDALQALSREQAALLFPGCTADAPGVIALPSGIHPFNRAAGYYEPVSNWIVFYQELGRLALSQPEHPAVLRVVQHELCHWAQFNLLESDGFSSNCHRLSSWSEACWQASTKLWPDAALERAEFNYRRRADPHLSDTELHHWPHSMPAYLKRSRQLNNSAWE